tara:strand:+ start:302 stop:616 length:315 start_codon:yes stop_codon:yes gene_type:complete
LRFLKIKLKMKIKILIVLLIFFTSACSGMGGKRSDKSDEFLIEKKNPLVMPPKINKLPKPKDSADLENTDNNFQKKISGKSKDNLNSQLETSTSLEESIIKKIE